MKILKFKSKIVIYLLVLSLIMVSTFSCKKDDYRTDTGLATSKSSLTTYDYLANNAYHYFDTLLMIVDHLGLKDSLNKSGTFFAPTNFAINRVMSDKKIPTLDSLYKTISSKFLTQYMFGDTAITLANASETVKTYVNWADGTVGISKLAASYSVVNTSLKYYILRYIKINGVLDGSPNRPSNDETDAFLNCQTTGIISSSGTNLNVLANTATLNLY